MPRSRERSADAATDIYLKEVGRYPLLSREEEQCLARAYRDKGDVLAGHKLVTSNLRFVIKIALDFRRRFVRMADLVQEGNIGLIKAVEKFDPDRGVRFVTYAVWWIRAYMQKFIVSQRNLVRLGKAGFKRRIFLSPGDVSEEAERLGRNEVSLDQPISDSSDSLTTHQDMLEDPAPLPDAQCEESESRQFLRDKVFRVSLMLDERERCILLHRLMADADDRWTLEQCGNRFGVSRERVRQIENQLKKKLEIFLR